MYPRSDRQTETRSGRSRLLLWLDEIAQVGTKTLWLLSCRHGGVAPLVSQESSSVRPARDEGTGRKWSQCEAAAFLGVTASWRQRIERKPDNCTFWHELFRFPVRNVCWAVFSAYGYNCSYCCIWNCLSIYLLIFVNNLRDNLVLMRQVILMHSARIYSRQHLLVVPCGSSMMGRLCRVCGLEKVALRS